MLVVWKTIVQFGGRIIPLQDKVIEFIRTKLENGVASVEKPKIGKGRRFSLKMVLSKDSAASLKMNWTGKSV